MERIKILLPETFSFSTKIRVRITDLNYGGHVGNDSFLSLMHEARQQYLNHYGYKELAIEGFGLIMSDVQVEFKKELSFADEVTISVAASGFDKFGFDIFYRLELIENDKKILVAKAKTGMLLYDYANKKLVMIPTVIKEKLMGNAMLRQDKNECRF